MDDRTLLDRIRQLVDEEHELRTRYSAGQLSADEEHARLGALEEALDQCWDLLRRRRAARESGGDPDAVQPRPTGEVESYLQ
ncbi:MULTISPECIES: DUF2630 family protein [unclassified Solwaraspora]|uniref:DUF2630 family protein n=1 Tax=unclassified Solwaraspora TaxID=2627926 RepID=UPI00259B1F10|nr:DUF2630 family protein [Solwaraspora sp. WMMA2056]WJK38356.1 DUF2630 family protein [Solwaraspora sp. WMMA2056]